MVFKIKDKSKKTKVKSYALGIYDICYKTSINCFQPVLLLTLPVYQNR
jgi:hypothetical protein